MSNSSMLREKRTGTVINGLSKEQDKDIMKSVVGVAEYIEAKYENKIFLDHKKSIHLKIIVEKLLFHYKDIDFCYEGKKSFIKPDGGFLFIKDKSGEMYPICISEKKNQGTNDIRMIEGKPRQAMGNAIERLGKNVRGIAAYMKMESIFPFICFGDGCDFKVGSSIRDRVITMNEFVALNKECLYNQGPFQRGSFYFREEKWTIDEMYEKIKSVAEKSIEYYFSKYGKDNFLF